MTGPETTKLLFDNALKIMSLAREFVFGEIDKWAEENRVDAGMMSKLRSVRIESGKQVEVLRQQVAAVMGEILEERDKKIAALERTILEMAGEGDSLKALRQEINALLKWMHELASAMQRIAEPGFPTRRVT